ncbi:MAG TPA: hypothetical protein VKU00_23390 [Chthonomonadaceae bacterium]|nr:hypothetical protein [Chthonomonadaceae bacterium]
MYNLLHRFFRHGSLAAVLICSLVGALQSQAAYAEDACAKLLKPLHTFKTSNRTKQYAFLRLVTRELFDTIKKSAGGGINLPLVDGLPIGAYGNYEEFQSHLNKDFAEEANSGSASEALTEINEFYSSSQLKAIEICLRNRSDENKYVKCIFESITENTIIITVKWDVPIDSPEGDIKNYTLRGATPDIETEEKLRHFRFRPGEETRLVFEKKPNLAFVFFLTVNHSLSNIVTQDLGDMSDIIGTWTGTSVRNDPGGRGNGEKRTWILDIPDMPENSVGISKPFTATLTWPEEGGLRQAYICTYNPKTKRLSGKYSNANGAYQLTLTYDVDAETWKGDLLNLGTSKVTHNIENMIRKL